MADQFDTDDSSPKRMKLEEKPSEENAETGIINKTSIMDLPDELKIEIFKQLPKYDIFKNVALVCKEFHRVSQDSKLVTDLCFTNEELVNLENKFQILRRISSSNNDHAEESEKFQEKTKELSKKIQKIGLHGIKNEDQIEPFIEKMKFVMSDKEKSEIELVRRAKVSSQTLSS